MTLIVVTPPAVMPVTLEEFRQHSAISDDGAGAEEEHLNSLLAAAVDYLDGPNGRLGRCLITQTLNLKLDTFPAVIELPCPPLQAVVSVYYRDANGQDTLLPSTDYQVAGVGGFGKGELYPAVGRCWPATQWGAKEAIAITFRAGYGDEAADVPAVLRHMVKLLAAHWLENREVINNYDGTSTAELPYALRDLIYSCRSFP